MGKKSTKSEEPKKKKPISLNTLEIAKRLQKLEETGGGGGTPYTLPTASADTKGGVKIGEGLTMNGEVLSATGGPADSAKRSDIATEFNTTTAYTAGCYVYHEGTLYQFNADHAAGAWDPTDVVEANVTDQIVSNKAAIDGLTASDVAYDNTGSGLTATDVQGALDSIIPRTASGTTLVQLISAIGQLSEEQKFKCIIKVNNVYRLTFAMRNTATIDWYNALVIDGTNINEFKLEIDGENSSFKRYISNGTSTSIAISAWTLYYQGTPIS